MIFVELTGADDEGLERVFYFSSAAFQTGPDDDPQHTAFEPALRDGADIGVSVFSDGRTGGGTQIDLGQIVIVNADGSYDELVDYGFDGRPVVVRTLGAGGTYPDGYPVVFRGTAQGVEATFGEIIIRLQDKQAVFDKPVQTTRYAGDNALPNGLEGTADDLKGQPKPRLYGKALNIAPPCVNTSKLTYQVSDGAVAEITAVYDRGAALAFDQDYATSALLQAATVASGEYATCLAEGYFRIGASPTGQVTCDAAEGATAAARTVAQILKRLALAAEA